MKLRIISLTFVIFATTLLSGCLSMHSYVDPALPAAHAADVTPVVSPAPIQLLYEFRTKDVLNARATEGTRARITEDVKQSKLFSEVSSAPVANQRRLAITVSNVPITSEGDAKAKGFGTGLTLGLVGSTVTDGYECEATYTVAGSAPLKLTYKHAMHTTIGNAAGPPGLVATSPQEAVNRILDQFTWSILRDLSKTGGL